MASRQVVLLFLYCFVCSGFLQAYYTETGLEDGISDESLQKSHSKTELKKCPTRWEAAVEAATACIECLVPKSLEMQSFTIVGKMCDAVIFGANMEKVLTNDKFVFYPSEAVRCQSNEVINTAITWLKMFVFMVCGISAHLFTSAIIRS